MFGETRGHRLSGPPRVLLMSGPGLVQSLATSPVRPDRRGHEQKHHEGVTIPTRTSLASGQITAADQLTVKLVQALETPAAILISWPDAPSVTDPRKLVDVAAATMTILAEARAALARVSAAEPLAGDPRGVLDRGHEPVADVAHGADH